MSARMKLARAVRQGDPARTMMRAMPGVGYRRQGDPGLFGFLGKAIGGAVKGVSRLAGALPGPAGFVGSALGSVLGTKAARGNIPTLGLQSGSGLPQPGFGNFMERVLPFGQTGRTTHYTRAEGPPGPGYHLNKTDYHLKDGTFVPKQSVWVKNRRRNPLNPRALDRAMGRITSAKNAAGKLSRITIRKACA